ncbi:MAG: hypothetical protein RSE41_05085 [Clostridia bacterium]
MMKNNFETFESFSEHIKRTYDALDNIPEKDAKLKDMSNFGKKVLNIEDKTTEDENKEDKKD